jgi:signal transduction histidine kinase
MGVDYRRGALLGKPANWLAECYVETTVLRLLGSRLWLRLAATFVAASVLPILGAFVLTTRLLEANVKADASRRERALAELTGSLVRDFIARGTEKITTVSRLIAQENPGHLDESNRKAVLARLGSLVEPPDAYLELDFFSKEGEVLNAPQTVFQNAQTDQSFEGQQARNSQQRGRSVVRTPLELGKAFVGDLEDNAGFTTLPISVPMTRGEQQLGAVVAYLDFRRVTAILESAAQGGYAVELQNRDGHTLASGGLVVLPALSETVSAGHTDWTVTVSEPAARVYSSLAHVRRQVELWGAAGSALAILLSFFMAARIVRPVAKLSEAARAMEKGDLAARTRIVGSDEIGTLAQNFDRMAAALEKLDDAKSEFVASVSHELRTPLTAIRLSIANLLDGVLGPIDDGQRETLARLKGDVDRMIVMVNDLLEMARLEAGAVVAKREPLDLAVLGREVAAALEPLARAKKIAVSVTGEGRVEGDRSQLHRVLSNLVDNAIKFTPEGGTVTIAVEGRVVRVVDQGPGVSNPRLFEMFAQAPVHGVKPRGTGVGLAIVKKLVELHGGTVTSEPHEGGACFVVTL